MSAMPRCRPYGNRIRALRLGFGVLILLWISVPWVAGVPEARDTIVVANADLPESVAVAEYYLEQRGIPRKNLILLPLPTEETIPWQTFAADLFNPLRAELEKRDRITLLPTGQQDRAGRRIDTVIAHSIAYMVLCYGVPLRIQEDPRIVVDSEVEAFRAGMERTFQGSAMREPRREADRFLTNRASVDAELALLTTSGSIPTTGFLPNPLFLNPSPGLLDRTRVVRVSRLDGPSPEAVRRMIDSAIQGEKRGLLGRAYIDQDGRTTGGYALGNHWLRQMTSSLENHGFSITRDEERAVFPLETRFDAPALYFGWWTWNLEGPFTLPGFRFPEGAVAVHIHSFSAETLRKTSAQTDARWCGPLVERGVAATLGNVYEPYLQFSHHLDTFLDALLRGASFGEAAYEALPVLSWMPVAIGDPLYRPFARDLETQLSAIPESPGDATTYSYAILRKTNQIAAESGAAEALSHAQAQFPHAPSLALAWKIAQLAQRTQNPSAAKQALQFVESVASLSSTEWVLAKEIAVHMHREFREAALARHLIGLVMDDPNLPAAMARALLPDAIIIAQAAHDHRAVQRWRARARD